MAGTLSNVKIAGIACAVPRNKVDQTGFYDTFGEKAVKKFVKMTGVKQRYVSDINQTSSDLAYTAAVKLIEKLDWERDSIDGLFFVTQTPDYRIPATACTLHSRLGLKEDCVAFDINLGCSGYVYGIQMAAAYMNLNDMKKVLLLVGDTLNKSISEKDKSSVMLFGEAGSATALEVGTDKINYLMKTRGNGFKAIIIPSGAYRNLNGVREARECAEGIIRSDYDLYMNGTDVFNFTIEDVPKTLKCFKERFSINDDDVDMYVLHQANLFMLKTIASRSGISMDKMPISIDRFGNTSVTSIPLTICDACEKISENRKLNLICSGFGVGLSWGVISMNIDSEMCLPVIYTDEHYENGGLEFND